ncbi:hypothetical protein [Chryseobacterium populi]|uniref:Lipoprotein n=1 Tax=Chryseobacterium populi TaxID=1144316 RepID=J2KMB9_9FLAO|nr:hypothetical protein [Chryseobacterium populi]EJL74233.1 hypothetical protein PMI13_00966 [Chryseobacterium populi]
MIRITIVIFILLMFGCKKVAIISVPILVKEDTIRNEINGITKESFVISCGSGCAMTYSPENIEQLDKSIKVKFNVDMYVDEAVTETYKEIYIFSYGNSGEVEKINLEGKNENVLETLMPDAQESFRDFGNRLLMNADKNVKIKTASNKIADQKANQQWLGSYSCRFLRMKEESGDPRGWGTIVITIDKNSAEYQLDSYIENLKKDLTIVRAASDEIVFSEKDNKNSILTISRNNNKYMLKSTFMDKISGNAGSYELKKK